MRSAEGDFRGLWKTCLDPFSGRKAPTMSWTAPNWRAGRRRCDRPSRRRAAVTIRRPTHSTLPASHVLGHLGRQRPTHSTKPCCPSNSLALGGQVAEHCARTVSVLVALGFAAKFARAAHLAPAVAGDTFIHGRGRGCPSGRLCEPSFDHWPPMAFWRRLAGPRLNQRGFGQPAGGRSWFPERLCRRVVVASAWLDVVGPNRMPKGTKTMALTCPTGASPRIHAICPLESDARGGDARKSAPPWTGRRCGAIHSFTEVTVAASLVASAPPPYARGHCFPASCGRAPGSRVKRFGGQSVARSLHDETKVAAVGRAQPPSTPISTTRSLAPSTN